jgi:hypothetical protein
LNREDPAWINYQQMVKDHCETSVWDAEWLRVVRRRGERAIQEE